MGNQRWRIRQWKRKILTGAISDSAMLQLITATYQIIKMENGMRVPSPKIRNVVINECAGILQYCQECFEGLKAYTTEDGSIVTFRPDLNVERMMDSCARLECRSSRRSASWRLWTRLLRQMRHGYRRTAAEQLFTSVRTCSLQVRLSV